MPSYDRALWALRTWLDSWRGIGHVAVGMHRQGYDLQLTQYDERGWRAILLHHWNGAQPGEFHRDELGENPVACGATCSLGRTQADGKPPPGFAHGDQASCGVSNTRT